MSNGCPQIDVQQLVQDHHADVYRYAHRLCGQAADAEDLAQQTFLIAHRKLEQLRDPEKARSWLLAIARNCFLKWNEKQRPAPASNVELSVDDIALPADDVEVDAEALQAAVQELPSEFRVVILMYYFEFLSYRDIAEELEIPVGTVMSRLARAKRHLRRRLMESGGQSPERPLHPAPLCSTSEAGPPLKNAQR